MSMALLAVASMEHGATIHFEDGTGGNLAGAEVFSGLVTVNVSGKGFGVFQSDCNGNG